MSIPWTRLDRPPLRRNELERALIVPNGLWSAIDIRDQTRSTNRDIAEAARAGAAEGLIVTADDQTAGRGRHDRQWVSPPRSGIAVSVLLRPGDAVLERDWGEVPKTCWAWLPLLVGVAVARSVAHLGHIEARLKWPNDLLLGPELHKAAGVLTEAVDSSAVTVGIGLNVTNAAAELPRPDATSLLKEGASCTDRSPLLLAMLRAIADDYTVWREHGGDAEAAGLREAYRQSCATLGRDVRVQRSHGAPLLGEAVDVDGTGRLVVATDAGQVPVAAGDVVHVR